MKASPAARDTARSLTIIGILFFVFGFVTWLGSVLIPYLRIACQIDNFSSYLVAFSFYISYAVFALPSAALLRRTGYKKGMALGLVLMAAGTGCFIPAALTRAYPLFLTGLFIQGSGLAILQTAVNPYVTILGPMDSAARRISIMGICNGVAGIVAPLIIGAYTLKDADAIRANSLTLPAARRTELLDGLAHRAIPPYAVMSLVLLALAAWVLYSALPEVRADDAGEAAAGDVAEQGKSSLLHHPHLLLGAMTLFLYVGVEVIAGDTIIGYGASQGIKMNTARFFTSVTLFNMLIGYLIGILLIPRYLSQPTALKISSGLGLCFAAVALSTHGITSIFFVALLGLANALVWPSIWPLAIDGLGKLTAIGSSLLIIAIGGGALLPLGYGWLADHFSPRGAYWIVVPCYACIGWYAFRGRLIGRRSVATPN